jgi:hypothetical protein
MLPEITWKAIRNVAFPVFKLNSDEVHYYEGILYCQDKIIDDRNMPGNTIGIRRLHIPKEDLYRLNRSAFDFMALLQAKHRHFIDNKGRAFSYTKIKRVLVENKKIEKIIHRDSCSIVKIRGIKSDLIVRRPPPAGFYWAGVVFIDGFPWEIIEYAENQRPSYIRMI